MCQTFRAPTVAENSAGAAPAEAPLANKNAQLAYAPIGEWLQPGQYVSAEAENGGFLPLVPFGPVAGGEEADAGEFVQSEYLFPLRAFDDAYMQQELERSPSTPSFNSFGFSDMMLLEEEDTESDTSSMLHSSPERLSSGEEEEEEQLLLHQLQEVKKETEVVDTKSHRRLSVVADACHKEKRETSLEVFEHFIGGIDTENPDVSRALSVECYQAWIKSRKVTPHNGPEAFRKTLTSYVTCADKASKPFPEPVEQALLEILRKKQTWPCFAAMCNPLTGKPLRIGANGVRCTGYHEKKRQTASRRPDWTSSAGRKPKRLKAA